VTRSFEASRAAGLVVIYNNRLADTSVRNNIAVDADGFVVRYDKEALDDAELDFVEAGVLAFRRSVVALIPEGCISLEKQVFGELIAARQLYSYQTSRRFYDIGTPERLRIFEEYLAHDYHKDAFSH
jgi:NDP-sugar pyrophosphorylase family protein